MLLQYLLFSPLRAIKGASFVAILLSLQFLKHYNLHDNVFWYLVHSALITISHYILKILKILRDA